MLRPDKTSTLRIGTREAGDMAVDMLLDRRRQGTSWNLAVVDHGEAAWREPEAPAADPGNRVALRRLRERQAGLRCKPFSQRFDLTLAQRGKQVARKDDTLAGTMGMAFLDQMPFPSVFSRATDEPTVSGSGR